MEGEEGTGQEMQGGLPPAQGCCGGTGEMKEKAVSNMPIEDKGDKGVQRRNNTTQNQHPNTQTQRYQSQTLKTRE